MLRSFLISLSKAGWAQRLISGWGFARRAASRFVPGEKPEDALRAIRELNAKGINATLDHLGEDTTTPQGAQQATREVLSILEEIEKAGVRSNVSVKLSQIGLALDEEVCAANLKCILEKAGSFANFVRVDMEDTHYTEATIRMVQRMRQEGLGNVGVVIQSYLYRSEKDVSALMEAGVRVRLCKGAYKEPPEAAYPQKKEVDASYDRLAERLLGGAQAVGCPPVSPDGKIPPIPAIASHDVRRIQHVREAMEKMGVPRQAVEFQMLYGIRRDLQEELCAQGYPVRVYVPYGTHWYPYFMRRLAERPANLWFFLSNYFRK